MDPSWSPTGAGVAQFFRGLSLAVQFLSSHCCCFYKNAAWHQCGRLSDGLGSEIEVSGGNCRILSPFQLGFTQ